MIIFQIWNPAGVDPMILLSSIFHVPAHRMTIVDKLTWRWKTRIRYGYNTVQSTISMARFPSQTVNVDLWLVYSHEMPILFPSYSHSITIFIGGMGTIPFIVIPESTLKWPWEISGSSASSSCTAPLWRSLSLPEVPVLNRHRQSHGGNGSGPSFLAWFELETQSRYWKQFISIYGNVRWKHDDKALFCRLVPWGTEVTNPYGSHVNGQECSRPRNRKWPDSMCVHGIHICQAKSPMPLQPLCSCWLKPWNLLVLGEPKTRMPLLKIRYFYCSTGMIDKKIWLPSNNRISWLGFLFKKMVHHQNMMVLWLLCLISTSKLFTPTWVSISAARWIFSRSPSSAMGVALPSCDPGGRQKRITTSRRHGLLKVIAQKVASHGRHEGFLPPLFGGFRFVIGIPPSPPFRTMGVSQRPTIWGTQFRKAPFWSSPNLQGFWPTWPTLRLVYVRSGAG